MKNNFGVLFAILFYVLSRIEGQDFLHCHDDPTFEPEIGTMETMEFNWLGVLQYIHVKNGTPHYFRVPRVVLLTKQFVLATARDAAQVPEEYALGNVIFNDYERDESECDVSAEQLSNGATCQAAVLLMPIADVLVHPEYKHFGVKHSIALLKLLKAVRSSYLVPICLPFKDFTRTKYDKQSRESFYYVDFMADVPRDYILERKEVKTVKLLPRELCMHFDAEKNSSVVLKDRIACTTGCSFHSGSPIIMHEHTGHWSLVALSEGGSPCPDPLVARRPSLPPRHILIYSYVPWITAAISGKPLTAFSKDDPFGYIMPRSFDDVNPFDKVGHEWIGHWWMGGYRCKDRGDMAIDLFRFYHEIFQIKPMLKNKVILTYYLEIDAMHGTNIICVKVGLPYRLGQPRVWQLDTPTIKAEVPVLSLQYEYSLQVEAFAYNVTETSETGE